MTYDAVDFVLQYDQLIQDVLEYIESDVMIIWLRFKFMDPHDLVSPERMFEDHGSMVNYLVLRIYAEYIDHGHSLEN